MNNISYSHYQKKEPWVAVLLSFVITGAGQMYCGRVGKGVVLLIGAIIGGMLFLLPGLMVWAYGMFDAYNMAQEINEEIEKNIINQNHIIEQEEEKIKEEAIEKEKSLIKVDDFKERLVKNHKLYDNSLITENEHITRKKNIINELLTKKTTISHDDFLYELISLKENNILTNEDMQLIKSHLL
ncbi:MAG: hypothetical protein ACE5ES_04195 [Candidatus Nanoarchaeia archaeon]